MLLFALTGSSPAFPDCSPRAFFQRDGNTKDLNNGWGLALFGQGRGDMQTHQANTQNCRHVVYVLDKMPEATTVIAQVRKATECQVSHENTQPFVHTLWGEVWGFAHNGELNDFHPEFESTYESVGNTDSERAFWHLMSRLEERFEHKPLLADLTLEIKAISQSIARHGVFNFLLSNGTLLLAHCSTELYWTHQNPTL